MYSAPGTLTSAHGCAISRAYHGRLPPPTPSYETNGNAALNKLFGAVLHNVMWSADRRALARGQTQELESAHIEMIDRLALAAEYRDEQTSGHSQRVGLISSRLAEAIGWTVEDAGMLRRAAALHGIGKIGIPDASLQSRTR